MKKICILALHLGYGGVEKSIAALANLLALEKHYQVEIVSIYQLYKKPVFTISEKVKIKYLLKEELTPNAKEWKESVKQKRPFKILKESWHSLKVLYLRRKTMALYLKESDADVIISTRDFLNDLLSTYGNPKALRIAWEHNHHHNNRKYAMDVVRSAKHLDYLVLVSKDLQRFYRREMIEYPCKCVYIPNTLEKMPPRKSPLTKKRLVSVGRLSPEKGYLDLLKIYQIVREKNPDWVLDIIGDGNERSALEAYIKENQLQDSVTLHGFQDSDYIDKILQKSSIYVMTSFTESFGIVLLEAMSHGLPCLAFDSAEGAREIITSGKDGYLIRHRNFVMMTKKIQDLINSEEKRKELGTNGRKKVKLYGPERIKEHWLRLIEKRN